MADALTEADPAGRALLAALKLLSEQHLGVNAELSVRLRKALESRTSEAVHEAQAALARLPDGVRDSLLAAAHRMLAVGLVPGVDKRDADRRKLH